MRPSGASNQPGSRVGASDITRRSANPVGAPAITLPSEACVTTGGDFAECGVMLNCAAIYPGTAVPLTLHCCFLIHINIIVYCAG